MYRVPCFVCQGLSSNLSLCVHERAVVNAGQSSNEQRFENQRCEDDELYFSDEEGMNEENDTTKAEDISYTSTIHRSFFPFSSDEKAMANLYCALLNRNGTNSPFLGMDRHPQFPVCGIIVSDVNQCQTHKRDVNFHTLHHGSISIKVLDVTCPERECNATITNNGVDDRLFSTRKEHVFTKELLDSSQWDVCGTGGTYRDAFYSWSSKACMKSAEYQGIGEEP